MIKSHVRLPTVEPQSYDSNPGLQISRCVPIYVSYTFLLRTLIIRLYEETLILPDLILFAESYLTSKVPAHPDCPTTRHPFSREDPNV